MNHTLLALDNLLIPCLPLLALAIIGVNSSLFDDSFSVWENHPDLPVEKGT